MTRTGIAKPPRSEILPQNQRMLWLITANINTIYPSLRTDLPSISAWVSVPLVHIKVMALVLDYLLGLR